MTLLIGDNAVVTIDFTLTDDEGTVIDSSEGQEPLVYLHGAHNIIPGLEAALTGKASGASLSVSIPPEEGYGAHDENMIQAVPLEAFESVEKLETGMQLMVQTPDGEQVISIVEIGEKEVKVDGNHPLAGQTLHFAVEVKEVRDATEQEKEHGHVHAEGHDH